MVAASPSLSTYQALLSHRWRLRQSARSCPAPSLADRINGEFYSRGFAVTIERYRSTGKWEESKHPRDTEGQFVSGEQHEIGYETKKGEKKTRKEWRMPGGLPLPRQFEGMKLPPGWANVEIATDPNAKVMARGVDAKGRKQSVYSAQHIEAQAKAKFARVNEGIRKLDDILSENKRNLSSADPAIREVATVQRLIMHTGIRPGSERDTGAKTQAFGATTLIGSHVTTDEAGSVVLRFTGKKGVSLEIPIEDPEIAAVLLSRKAHSGETGQLFSVNDSHLRRYVRTLDGGGFKTKDFRTIKGTMTATAMVESMPKPKTEKDRKEAIKHIAIGVSKKLGNTPAVALQSYIDPHTFDPWKIGKEDAKQQFAKTATGNRLAEGTGQRGGPGRRVVAGDTGRCDRHTGIRSPGTRIARLILRHQFAREFYRRLSVERYAGWVTIGGGPGPGGKQHAGGTPVKLGLDGDVEAGPKALQGKKLHPSAKAKTETPKSDWAEQLHATGVAESRGVKARIVRSGDSWAAEVTREGQTTQVPAGDWDAAHAAAMQALGDAAPSGEPQQKTMFEGIAPKARGKNLPTDTPAEQKKLSFPKPPHDDSGMAAIGGSPYPVGEDGWIRPWGEKLNDGPPPGVRALPDGRWVGTAVVHRDDVEADPERFQYKVSGIGSGGVTDVQKEVTQYDPGYGGMVQVWRDPGDGKVYVINGHHRLDIAKRSTFHDWQDQEGQEFDWHGEMPVQFINAKDESEARAKGALTNIAEGHGTALDAANFMRETKLSAEDLSRYRISLKGNVAKYAAPLSKVSDKIFREVHSGMLDEKKAASFGTYLADNDRKQNELLATLRKRENEGRSYTQGEVDSMARRKRDAGQIKVTTKSLWGDEETEEDTFAEEAVMETGLRRSLSYTLGKLAGISSDAAREVLESRGAAQINTEAAKGEKNKAQGLLDMFKIEIGHGGELNSAIQQAALEYKNDPRKERGKSEHVDRLATRAVSILRGLVEGPIGEIGGGDGGRTEPEPGVDREGGAGGPAGGQFATAAEPARFSAQYHSHRLIAAALNERICYSRDLEFVLEQEDKVTQIDANYRPGFGGPRCGSCSHYRQGGKCAEVEGKILQFDVCDLWGPGDGRDRYRRNDSPGQKSFSWKEDDHPRENDGKFAENDSKTPKTTRPGIDPVTKTGKMTKEEMTTATPSSKGGTMSAQSRFSQLEPRKVGDRFAVSLKPTSAFWDFWKETGKATKPDYVSVGKRDGFWRVSVYGASADQVKDNLVSFEKWRYPNGEAPAEGKSDNFRVSRGEGYGGRPFTTGQIVKNKDRNGDRWGVVEECGRRYVSEEGMSFGVGDESGYIYWANLRPATDEEIAAEVDRRDNVAQKANDRKAKKERVREITDTIKAGGIPEGDHSPDGDRLFDTQSIYGGGSWFVIAKEHIWFVKNNGMDGDDWGHNNVRTGGAGAIGWRIPRDPKLENELRSLAKDAV